MKQSLSTRIFLWFNNKLGKNKKRDKIITFFAFNLIYILAVSIFLYSFFAFFKVDFFGFSRFIIFLIVTFSFSMIASYLTGWIFPNPRPSKTIPGVKEAYKPFTSWKSFPSDHTIGSFILAESLIYIGAPLLVWLSALVVALCVGIFRVAGGLHYPRDIVGGIIYASVACLLYFFVIGL